MRAQKLGLFEAYAAKVSARGIGTYFKALALENILR